MMDSIQEATDSFHRWNNAWNTGNVEKQIREMHFPNVRLDGENRFEMLETEIRILKGKKDDEK